MSRVSGRVVAATLFMLGCGTEPTAPPAGVRTAWRIEGRGWNVTPSTDDQRVFFQDRNHTLIALDQATGAERWRARTPVQSQFPEGFNTVTAGDVVAVADLSVFAFDRKTGAAAWSFGTADDVPGWTTIASDGAAVYAASYRNRVYAIDAATGAQRWVTQLPGDSATSAFRARVHNGMIFVGTKRFGVVAAGAFAALDAATGAIRWVHDFEPGYPGALIGCLGYSDFHAGSVIVAAEDGRVYSFDVATGAVRWTAGRVHPIPPAPGGAYGDTRPLVVVGDVAVIGSTSGALVGIDAATGVERWRHDAGFVYPHPNVMSAFGADAIVVSSGGEVVFVNAATGAVRMRTLLNGSRPTDAGLGDAGSSVVSAGRRLFVAGFTGYYALSPD